MWTFKVTAYSFVCSKSSDFFPSNQLNIRTSADEDLVFFLHLNKIRDDRLFSLFSTYLQNLCSLFSVLWHVHWVTGFAENRAVVVDVQHHHLHSGRGAESRAAAVRRHHLQVVLRLRLPVQAPWGRQSPRAEVKMEVSAEISSWTKEAKTGSSKLKSLWLRTWFLSQMKLVEGKSLAMLLHIC